MTPQFVDLNDDGFEDMVMGTYGQKGYVIWGTKDGWEEPEVITNVDGEPVDPSPNPHQMTSVTTVDWDNDGDQDLLLGCSESGGLYLCPNVGSPKEPKFSTEVKRVSVEGSGKLIPAIMNAHIVDWNGDDLFDIVCGGKWGGVFLMLNTGQEGEPRFEEVQEIVPRPTAGKEGCRQYPNTMEIIVPTMDKKPVIPSKGWHVEVCDVNEDGHWDLLVGGRAYFYKEEKQLSEAEQQELKRLNEELDKVLDVLNQMEDREERDEEPYKSASEKFEKIYRKIKAIDPDPDTAYHFLWLFLNEGE